MGVFMKILLSIISLISMKIRNMRQQNGFLFTCHNFDVMGNAFANKYGQNFFEEIMDDFTTFIKRIKNPRTFFAMNCMRTFIFCSSILFSLVLTSFAHANNPANINPRITSGTYSQEALNGVWRLRIFDAAIVQGDTVMLGEIAEPLGDISAQEWDKLAKKSLWPAPTQTGKPFQINKQRLLGALRQYIGMYADSCILPNSLAIQKGGAVVYEEDLRRILIQRLSPQINALGGHSDLTDYRLPPYIFVSHASQGLIVEPTEVKAGRLNLRFAIQELDGSIVRRFSGSAFLNLWVDAPTLVRPMSRGEGITPSDITHKAVNLAFENGELWDGRGGPWQLVRPVGALEALHVSDLQPLAAIHKGDKVLLLYEKGNIRLSIVVEAMEDGGLGDLILLKNLDSKKQIYGMVKDQNTVISR